MKDLVSPHALQGLFLPALSCLSVLEPDSERCSVHLTPCDPPWELWTCCAPQSRVSFAGAKGTGGFF